MELKYFPNFVRAVFPVIATEPTEILIELGKAFNDWLLEKYKDKMEVLEAQTDIRPITIIMGMGNPTKVKGYHPAFVYNFTSFVEEMKNQTVE